VTVDLARTCELIAEPPEPMALRLSGCLLVGVARYVETSFSQLDSPLFTVSLLGIIDQLFCRVYNQNYEIFYSVRIDLALYPHKAHLARMSTISTPPYADRLPQSSQLPAVRVEAAQTSTCLAEGKAGMSWLQHTLMSSLDQITFMAEDTYLESGFNFTLDFGNIVSLFGANI